MRPSRGSKSFLCRGERVTHRHYDALKVSCRTSWSAGGLLWIQNLTVRQVFETGWEQFLNPVHSGKDSAQQMGNSGIRYDFSVIHIDLVFIVYGAILQSCCEVIDSQPLSNRQRGTKIVRGQFWLFQWEESYAQILSKILITNIICKNISE